MDKVKYNVIMAGLLHDTGKLILRSEPQRKNHSQAGAEFLARYISDTPEILRAVKYHHASELKQAKLAADDISYIVYEADNIASSTDRRPNESGESGFNAKAPLESVFNVFGRKNDEGKKGDKIEIGSKPEANGEAENSSAGEKTGFQLLGLMERRDRVAYPAPVSSLQSTAEGYASLRQYLEKNFVECPPDRMSPNELLQVWEAIGSYIPASTARGEVADISLYDHQKLTAAIGACMYDYFQMQEIEDYREYCFTGTRQQAFRQEPVYLLVGADLSGIQNFLYTIPSKGALKSLRGRSFYLELLLENVADEILKILELSRCNLLYSGGGGFYLLLPNTSRTLDVLGEVNKAVNNWLLKYFGSRLYLAMGWAECSAADFKIGTSDQNLLGGKYYQVRSQIAGEKHARYNIEQLSQLFNPHSVLNRTKDGTRECSICHTSSAELVKYDAAADSDTWACKTCRNLRGLGEKLLKHNLLVVTDTLLDGAEAYSLPVPSVSGEKYITSLGHDKLEDAREHIRRVYCKNEMNTGNKMATRLWMGDYVTRSEYNNTMELEELAGLAGGSSDKAGIKRLGVMRADVDNLGAAFMAGFPGQYATLGRSAALSRQLSLFFKMYVNTLCAGEVNGLQEMQHSRFSLFGAAKDKARKVHIVYSGGDDMFIVGAWDELIELAVDIRRAFARFTNGKLTFSAGIGLFDSKCPMAEMARQSGALESAAKSLPEKDGIALFGVPDSESNKNYEVAVYKWQDFTEKVCGEKLAFCRQYLGYPGNEAPERLTAGKSLLYRLMELLIDTKGKINLARFAYAIARLEPKENSLSYSSYQKVRKQFYQWYKQEDDRKQLITALELIIYSIREKGE
ncbi:type III-A CRISPR-associated protein Cas10/Csm1 [Veillonellaceae bacterium WCA-693-APC-5D-A]|uniref:CRISPR system single-strand-specific deoxyribonuclease Cas10/Csm1 (subtype III-A) n=1 Tax=Anaerovibrio slackiae TaxID=2652309 RepID=A0A6I2UEW9_9FIRM|nr:type III-A CRISPR-associated protein Cas10/Csm1 [Anaerovibrio slackiae]MSU07711.1 type III-A CRISPR-associated protein Cas10/Csm1 [Anaerovibrio slackiae]